MSNRGQQSNLYKYVSSVPLFFIKSCLDIMLIVISKVKYLRKQRLMNTFCIILLPLKTSNFSAATGRHCSFLPKKATQKIEFLNTYIVIFSGYSYASTYD